MSRRLDLRAARHEVEAAQRGVTEARLRWVPDIEAGVEVEQELDGETIVGPALGIQIPLFNRNQGLRARRKAELRKSRLELEALAVNVRAGVRSARDALVTARRSAEFYRDTVLPLRTRLVGLTQRHYNFMLIGVYELLRTKQEELEAQIEYVDALREYWIARAELELAAGGRSQ